MDIQILGFLYMGGGMVYDVSRFPKFGPFFWRVGGSLSERAIVHLGGLDWGPLFRETAYVIACVYIYTHIYIYLHIYSAKQIHTRILSTNSAPQDLTPKPP